MPNYETGHAKNAANLGLLIADVTAMGVPYNPSNNAIKLVGLNAKKIATDNAMTGVNTARTPYVTAVNGREDAYNTMSPLVTRVMGSLKGSVASAAIIKDATTFANKTRGMRTGTAGPGSPDVPNDGVGSVSQMSFDNRKANFDSLVSLLSGEPLYNPNELDLKVVALTAYSGTLTPLNNAVNTTSAGLANARNTRNDVMYAPITGLFDLQKAVKEYVKGVVGASSPVYKNIAKIKFTNLTGQ